MELLNTAIVRWKDTTQEVITEVTEIRCTPGDPMIRISRAQGFTLVVASEVRSIEMLRNIPLEEKKP